MMMRLLFLFCFSPLFTVLLLLLSSITVAQETPYYTTAKFDRSVSHRTNVCDRQQALYNGNITLSEALSGLNLSVVLTNYQSPASTPFFTLNDEGMIDQENPGLFSVILDELAERTGFQWRNSYGVVLPIDSNTDGNKTWTDLLQWEVETYDISAGKWDRSIARMKSEISFPEGWLDSSMILVTVDKSSTSSSQESLNIWSFLLPFQWTVWLLLVVVVIITGVAYWLLERLDTSSDVRSLENHPGDAVFYTAITMTGHFEFQPQTTAAMILTLSTTFIALIIGAVYTANLASFLVARRSPASTIESVEQAVIMRAPICVQARVNIDDYLTEKYPEAVLVRKNDNYNIFPALQSGECSVAVMAVSEYEQYSRDVTLNEDCSLKWNGRVEQIIPAGFASDVDSGTLCTSLISHVLDLHLIEMKADGFLERQWEAHLQKTGTQNCIQQVEMGGDDKEETFSLGVDEMAGIFIIHVMLLGLAIIVAMIHYFRTKSLRERQQSMNLSMNGSHHGQNIEMASNKLNSQQERRRTSLTEEDEKDSSTPSSMGAFSSRSLGGGSFEVQV